MAYRKGKGTRKEQEKEQEQEVGGGVFDEEHGADDAEEQKRERETRQAYAEEAMGKVGTLIPRSMYVQIVVALMCIVSFSAIYYFIGAYTLWNITTANHAVFLSTHRAQILEMFVLCAVNIVYAPTLTLPSIAFVVSDATNPAWADLSHMSGNSTLVLSQMRKLLPFVCVLNRKVNEGADAGDPLYLTGDELIDAVSTRRTVKANTVLHTLLMQTTQCIPLVEGDCDDPERIYGLNGSFAGLAGLMEEFIASAVTLTQVENPTQITATHRSFQFVVSAMTHDLRAAIDSFTDIVSEDGRKELQLYSTLQIVFFVFSLTTTLGSFFCCLFPTHKALVGLAKKTSQINQYAPLMRGEGE